MSTATVDSATAGSGDAGSLPLAAARYQIGMAILRVLQRLDTPAREVALQHFGWSDPVGSPASGGPGKMLRGTLVLEVADAICGDPYVGMAGAVAVELTHNSTLLKDDVMDRDVTRRHRPAAWTVFGESQTVLASDALLVLGMSVLLEHSAEPGLAAFRALAEAYQNLITGQAMDLRFESCARVEVDECTRMAENKTAALIACSTRIGALLAGADLDVAKALENFGRHIGLAFQFVDDVLGIWGDTALTGKPVGSDIAARKKSLPVAYALSTPEAGQLRHFFAGQAPVTTEDITWVSSALDDLGAKTWAEERAAHHVATAEQSLARSGIPHDRLASLRAIGRFVTARTY